jgi:hypothetical protein
MQNLFKKIDGPTTAIGFKGRSGHTFVWLIDPLSNVSVNLAVASICEAAREAEGLTLAESQPLIGLLYQQVGLARDEAAKGGAA